MLTIDRAFNNIWRVSRPRPLVQRLILYCGLLTVGPVLIGASLSLTSYLITLSLGFIEETHAGKVLVLKVIALLLTSIAFAFMPPIVPNRRVRSRDALVAGLAAGLCFEAMKQGFGVFIAHFPTYKLVYGTFAVLPIFLLWIYVSWLIVVGGAVLTAVLPEWRERVLDNEPVPGSEFVSAIQALKLLCQAGHAGDPVSLSKLHGTVKERIDRLEEIMATLSTAGWTARAGRRGWVLARDATRIKVADIYRLFVFRADSAGFRDHASARLQHSCVKSSAAWSATCRCRWVICLTALIKYRTRIRRVARRRCADCSCYGAALASRMGYFQLSTQARTTVLGYSA